MRDIILITSTMLLAAYYFSIPKKLNGLEQIFLGLVSCFILSCFISVFADDLHWWKVDKDHHYAFKINEIFAKTFIALIIISFQLTNKKIILSLFLFWIVFQFIAWVEQGIDIVDYTKGWVLYGMVIHTCTFLLLIYLQKKFHQVLVKEGLKENEGTTTSEII